MESDHEAKIQEFRTLLEEEHPDHLNQFDDSLLIRFLVARSWNLTHAHDMLVACINWRIENKIDLLPRHGIDAPLLTPEKLKDFKVRGYKCIADGKLEPSDPLMNPEFVKFFPHLGGSAFHKFDKQGNPLFIERLGLFDAKQMAANCTAPVWIDFHTRNMEMLTKTLMKEASERTGRVVDKHTLIFDLKGLGFSHLHYPVIALLRSTSVIDSAYYPERLGKFFMINAPFVFTRAWAIVKGFLDKGILDKIHILGDNFREILLEHIDADHLPVEFGGKCECECPGGCVPKSRT
ncbi:cytosolic factor, phosphatidylinositol/phosphatidylcholine transfer protein [Nowakowskiella sp. JEL0078]|nr:cytosolic factor, phosphatidylinositol/phosphatidylcholine transfer protein [Nowakowskiella sp. JEL0078]